MRPEVPPTRPRLLAPGVGLGCAICVVAGLLASFAIPASAAEWTFAPNQIVHPVESGQHLWPDVVAGPGGFAGVTWMDDTQGEFHIYYSHTTNGGAWWSQPEIVDGRTTGTSSRFPHLALLPSGNVVVVWEDDRTGEFNVYLSKRDPAAGGPLWSTPQQINESGSPENEFDLMNASIAVYNEQRWFVAWTDWRDGDFSQLYLRTTFTGGQNWSFETRISDNLGLDPAAFVPCLVVDRTSPPNAIRLHCVANDEEGPPTQDRLPNVAHYLSLNGGATWQRGTILNDITDQYQESGSRSLALLANGDLVCGWLSDASGLGELRASRSTDNGTTWQPSDVVNQPSDGGIGSAAALTAAGNEVLVSYELFEDDLNCYFRSSPDGGASWTEPPVRMDDDVTGGFAGNSVIALGGPNEVYGVWQDSRPGFSNWQIFAARGERSALAVETDSANSAFQSFGSAWPNPSRSRQVVRLHLPAATDATRLSAQGPGATIVGSDGRLIRRIAPLPGQHDRFDWDGRDQNGRAVVPGVYWAIRHTQFPAARIVRVR